MARFHYKKYPAISLLARSLRNNQTPSEKLLWEELRKKKLSGYRFLRQHPVFYRINKGRPEFFIADFYCAELRLIIELDGKIHDTQIEYDTERDLKLLTKGIYVFRIKNEAVSDKKSVIALINEVIDNRLGQINDYKPINPPSLVILNPSPALPYFLTHPRPFP